MLLLAPFFNEQTEIGQGKISELTSYSGQEVKLGFKPSQPSFQDMLLTYCILPYGTFLQYLKFGFVGINSI